jgi:L-fucose isomerase-like protein
MGRDVEISELDILGETLGRENCFGAVKGHVAGGPMTYFRISTFTDDPFDMDGGIAVCKVPKLRELLAHLCQEGFEHHVAMARTHFAEVLREATEKYMNWDLYYHK